MFCLPVKVLNTLLLFCFFLDTLNAQNQEYFKGRVLDANTGKPIAFATIALKKKQIGVYSNEEGDFKFIKKPAFYNDSLVITSISYQKLTLAYRSLSFNESILFKLLPASTPIEEVLILGSSLNPRTVVRRAVKRIEKNCSISPSTYISYYRDYQKYGREFLNVNEAIIETRDKGFQTRFTSNSSILLDLKHNTDFAEVLVSSNYGDTKFMPSRFYLPDYGGNEFFILQAHNAVRNYKIRTFSFVDRFYDDFVPNHVFTKLLPVYDNKILLYKISFRASSLLNTDSLYFEGNVFIEPENYAIHKFEYACLETDTAGKKKEMYSVKLEYSRENLEDSLMALKYISFRNYFITPDPADTDYFKMTEVRQMQPLNPLETIHEPLLRECLLRFNHDLDIETAAKKENYSIIYGGKEASIKDIYVNRRSIILIIKKNEQANENYLRVTVKMLKDVNGNRLDKRKGKEYYQYRELFIQQYNLPASAEDTCIMKNIPLNQNCISKTAETRTYWMNTPEKIRK